MLDNSCVTWCLQSSWEPEILSTLSVLYVRRYCYPGRLTYLGWWGGLVATVVKDIRLGPYLGFYTQWLLVKTNNLSSAFLSLNLMRYYSPCQSFMRVNWEPRAQKILNMLAFSKSYGCSKLDSMFGKSSCPKEESQEHRDTNGWRAHDALPWWLSVAGMICTLWSWVRVHIWFPGSQSAPFPVGVGLLDPPSLRDRQALEHWLEGLEEELPPYS